MNAPCDLDCLLIFSLSRGVRFSNAARIFTSRVLSAFEKKKKKRAAGQSLPRLDSFKIKTTGERGISLLDFIRVIFMRAFYIRRIFQGQVQIA